jgi:hypothetical protein
MHHAGRHPEGLMAILKDRRVHFHAAGGWPDVDFIRPVQGEPYVTLTMGGRVQVDTQEPDGTVGKIESPVCWLGLFLEPAHARLLAKSILEQLPDEEDRPFRASESPRLSPPMSLVREDYLRAGDEKRRLR